MREACHDAAVTWWKRTRTGVLAPRRHRAGSWRHPFPRMGHGSAGAWVRAGRSEGEWRPACVSVCVSATACRRPETRECRTRVGDFLSRQYG